MRLGTWFARGRLWKGPESYRRLLERLVTRLLVPGVIVFAYVGLAANDLPAAQPIPWEKNHLKIGQALFRENCAVCHDVDVQKSKKFGPSFYHLFQREKMPLSNAKPNRAYIAVKIRVGGKIMPAFGKKLTPDEIATLTDYLASK